MNKLLLIVLIFLPVSYVYGSDSDKITEDKDVAWFTKNYGLAVCGNDVSESPNSPFEQRLKQTALLHEQCTQTHPNLQKTSEYIQHGAVLNAVLTMPGIRGRTYRLDPLFKRVILHADNDHVVDTCQHLIAAKEEPNTSFNPEEPPLYDVVQRYEKSDKSPQSFQVCVQLITLLAPFQYQYGFNNTGLKYALEEAKRHSSPLKPIFEDCKSNHHLFLKTAHAELSKYFVPFQKHRNNKSYPIADTIISYLKWQGKWKVTEEDKWVAAPDDEEPVEKQVCPENKPPTAQTTALRTQHAPLDTTAQKNSSSLAYCVIL